MSIKQELRRYYAKQGLTGKHLRKALQWDMKVVEKAKREQRQPASTLMHLYWRVMTQPRAYYWAHRAACTGG